MSNTCPIVSAVSLSAGVGRFVVPGVRPRPFRNVTWKPCRQSADVVRTATCCDFSSDLALSNSGRAGFPGFLPALRDVNYRPAKAANESFQEKSSQVSPRRTEKCFCRVPQSPSRVRPHIHVLRSASRASKDIQKTFTIHRI